MSVPHKTHIPLQSLAKLANCPLVSVFLPWPFHIDVSSRSSELYSIGSVHSRLFFRIVLKFEIYFVFYQHPGAYL
jgi:hypothetical protein